MKLRGLEVEQFRKFEAAARISGFGAGLNVLCGPNEFGKSTLLAAIRAVLFERFSSKADTVRRLQSWRGGAAPRVAMDFAVDGAAWRIEKRFLQQPMARLTDAGGAVWEGDQAEERLQGLLDFGAAGRKGAASEQMGVWGALWVSQRLAVEQADFSSDLARASVSRCLDAEVGVLTGGERGEAVRRAAETQLARLLDGNRRPRERYRAALEAILALEAALVVLRGRAEGLREAVDKLVQTQAALARREDAQAAAADSESLEDARRRRGAAQVAAERISVANMARERAVAEEHAALGEHRAREARTASRAGLEASSARSLSVTRREEEAAQAAAARQTSCRAALEDAEKAAAAAESGTRGRREVVTLAAQAQALATLQAALARAAPVQEEIEKGLALLDALRVDARAIEEIRKAAREREGAEAALLAQATSVELELLAAGGAVHAGSALPAGRTVLQAVTETEILLPGVGTIRIVPAMKDRDKSFARVDKAKAALAKALAACGCDAVTDAESAWRRREILDAEMAAARGLLAGLTAGNAAEGLAPGIAALRERCGVLAHGVREACARLELPGAPERGAAEAALREAERTEAALREAASAARAALDAAMREAGQRREAFIRAEADAKALLAELTKLKAAQDEAEAAESGEALQARLEAASSARALQEETLARLQRERGADSVEGMDARIARFEAALRNREQDCRRYREEIAGLRARIEVEGGTGLEEEIAAGEQRLGELTAERDAYAREAEVLRLLLDVLAAAERETKQRYLAPVTQRVTPYLQTLFPGAAIECDESLRITGVSRDGANLREFERLSDGTQEQIAVLARLAFAELLLDQGKPAMVILDDALAFSDDERMGHMFDALNLAARRLQILVFSCREEVFSRLGGTRLRVEAA